MLAELFQQAAIFLQDCPCVLLQPLISLAVLVIFVVVWIFVLLLILSSGELIDLAFSTVFDHVHNSVNRRDHHCQFGFHWADESDIQRSPVQPHLYGSRVHGCSHLWPGLDDRVYLRL